MAYSDAEVAEALIRLAVNKYDFDKTAKETGYPPQTLRRWNKKVPKKGVGDLLERAIERMLMHIPTDWRGQDWAVAVGILMDKWLLMQGEPTSRTEGVFRHLEGLKNDERNAVVAEAQRILAETAGRGAHPGTVGTAQPVDYRSAIAPFANGSNGHRPAPGEDEGSEHGPTLG